VNPVERASAPVASGFFRIPDSDLRVRGRRAHDAAMDEAPQIDRTKIRLGLALVSVVVAVAAVLQFFALAP